MQERPVVYKLGAGSSPTHSLKDLLISSSVDMEAATDANITALCTMYVVILNIYIFNRTIIMRNSSINCKLL